MSKGVIGRIIATVVAFFAYGIVSMLYAPQATLISGQVAGRQFENSDTAYLTSVYTMHVLGGVNVIFTLLLLAVLVAIWFRPAKDLFRKATTLMIVFFVASGMLLLGFPDVSAYFETKDRTEAYTILPNESAFWIPDAGDNKSAQAKMDSEEYLEANKVSLKRFIIPHQKLGGSSSWAGWDYYVPTGRLIIVDRTPYSREWVSSQDRGTSSKNEGFPCQTKEGLNITAGVSIGTSVTEQNAAKFLHRFGVGNIEGDRTKGEVIFTSVYYGRSLTHVMDDVGRKLIQTFVCKGISSRAFDKANEETNLIIEEVRDAAAVYFSSVGITLDFIGWADTFQFDPDVQKAVNDRYAANKLAEVLPVLQALAQLKVQEGLGKGLAEKGPPIVVTPDMVNALIGLVRPSIPQSPPAQQP